MGIKVLVVDDNNMMRGFLEKTVKTEKLVSEVFAAENGQKALDLIDRHKPDMVVMDVEMPVMDGLSALKEIKDRQKTGKINPKLKVIILSGTMYENDANVRKAKFLGAHAVMAKPGGKNFSLSADVGESLLKNIREVVG
ncbi:MAG: response regulator [Thermodesulfobacteriota bacterium]|nr:response regulator [Thermodesulfobacteriota bacterium]